MKEVLAVFIGSFLGSFIVNNYFSYKRKKMDNMEFDEEIRDAEYFSIKIEALEKRIEEIEKLIINAYKSVSQGKKDDK